MVVTAEMVPWILGILAAFVTTAALFGYKIGKVETSDDELVWTINTISRLLKIVMDVKLSREAQASGGVSVTFTEAVAAAKAVVRVQKEAKRIPWIFDATGGGK